jgi:hypothetical protein
LIDTEFLRRLSSDRVAAAAFLFPRRHPQPDAAMHYEMIDLCASADELVCIEAFREAGKTTKIEEHVAMAGCFGTFRYGLWGGETYEKSCQRLAAIDLELRTNDRLNAVFNGKVLARKSNENKIWFACGAVLQAIGWEQEIQSYKEDVYRPDFAMLDDVENRESVRDKSAVDANWTKLYDELMPAMDQQRMKIIMSQTRLAEDCMIVRASQDPNWLYRGFPICNGDPDDPATVATWPDRYPMDFIRKLKERYQRAGLYDSFLRVYMLQASNPEKKPFREDMLVDRIASGFEWQPKFVIYDPSRTSHEKRTRDVQQSARTGKVVVSQEGTKIVVWESSGHFWKPSELMDDFFSADRKHKPLKIGVETDSLDDWLMEPLRLQMIRRGRVLPIVALRAPHDQSKDEFINGLQAYFKAGDIVLVGGKAAHPQLVAEMANFPQGLRDILNALAYSLKMFSGYPVYEDFNGSNINDAPNAANGETVFVAFNASSAQVVASAVLREVRRFHVARDWTYSGATTDAVKSLAVDLRATYPRAAIQAWVPAETYDQWQRISLVPALRAEKITAYRGDHIAASRGKLADLIRNEWHQQKLFLVDRKAQLTLNALSSGYAYPAQRGGRFGMEPETGVSRLIAEALECMLSKLTQMADTEVLPAGANLAHTDKGTPYITVNPRAR